MIRYCKSKEFTDLIFMLYRRLPMLNTSVKKDIINQIGRLDYEHQRHVLDFARALAVTGPKGVSGKQLLSFAGSIPAENLKVIKKVIEDGCEKVDLNEW
jgi:hypothetical protein